MRTPEDILNLANKAVRTVTRGHRLWTMDDWADMQQEAALAILMLDGDSTEALCVHVAKHAAIDWMRLWLRTPRASIMLDWVDYGKPPASAWSLDYLAALPPLLTAQRAEKVDEDIAYLKLLLRGVSTAGIAMELGITERNVAAIHERLMPRLERIARGEGPPPWKVSLHDNSRKALDRINSDPAALARRGAAIRAGLARRKHERQGAPS